MLLMMFKPSKIAAVGDKDTLLALRAVGADTFSATTEDADEILKRLTNENYGIIFITEELAASALDTLRTLKTHTFPAVVLIPSAIHGAMGFANELLKKDIERALGTDAGIMGGEAKQEKKV